MLSNFMSTCYSNLINMMFVYMRSNFMPICCTYMRDLGPLQYAGHGRKEKIVAWIFWSEKRVR